MTYVYMLGDYEEHGTEHVVATLDRSSLPALAEKNWPETEKPERMNFTPEQWTARHREWVDEVKAGLADLLAQDDEELASQRGHACQNGWGGVVLYVIRLDGT